MLYPLPVDLTRLAEQPLAHQARYWYEGRCQRTGQLLRLPRTALAEAVAQKLIAQLGGKPFRVEGKMYGVLLVETPAGEWGWLKAFSGLLEGEAQQPGWVPPMEGRDRVALQEAQTLTQLENLKQELIALAGLPARAEHQQLKEKFEQQLFELKQQHRLRKQERQRQREQWQEEWQPEDGLDHELHEKTQEKRDRQAALLEAQSRRDGMEQRDRKRQRKAALAPLEEVICHADSRIRQLKQQRKQLSKQLYAEMQAAYRLRNFAGQEISLNQVSRKLQRGLPTGTGDCCAPKLLHYAAGHQLKPLAMAEFWWGPKSKAEVALEQIVAASKEKHPGQFYGACEERCQPLMGFLLSGLEASVKPAGEATGPSKLEGSLDFSQTRPRAQDLTLPILYEDDELIAVDKPAGLLSVPGRSRHNQDSVLSRLRCQIRDGSGELLGDRLQTIHRLDQDTSGILLLAKTSQSHRALQQQFQSQQILKIYEALLQGSILLPQGCIELPLGADPQRRPRQRVDWEKGKLSVTRFTVLERAVDTTRVRFEPATGRTHQLRIHAVEGLGWPIVGDRLYGQARPGERLCLHAQSLSFTHVLSHQRITLQSQVPF